ncbi:MAG TPA: hypothetical protein PKG54_11885 [Phycisphaerae bacterium]|jgi:hypothetical protein|nr:hypothetical protein [Phycisphaerae bacterium]HOJ54691.1 hypothetical protein [Phycisphaerae bacterium]HOL25959.1 hypothetical protein [Phycisphaerae bacterium]HPP19469.1 hypothetical protein [Phycisphaerae bacterium]HPU33967.1 hypothetical protein [Phycisphaerae bacterium]
MSTTGTSSVPALTGPCALAGPREAPCAPDRAGLDSSSTALGFTVNRDRIWPDTGIQAADRQRKT